MKQPPTDSTIPSNGSHRTEPRSDDCTHDKNSTVGGFSGFTRKDNNWTMNIDVRESSPNQTPTFKPENTNLRKEANNEEAFSSNSQEDESMKRKKPILIEPNKLKVRVSRYNLLKMNSTENVTANVSQDTKIEPMFFGSSQIIEPRKSVSSSPKSHASADEESKSWHNAKDSNTASSIYSSDSGRNPVAMAKQRQTKQATVGPQHSLFLNRIQDQII